MRLSADPVVPAWTAVAAIAAFAAAVAAGAFDDFAWVHLWVRHSVPYVPHY